MGVEEAKALVTKLRDRALGTSGGDFTMGYLLSQAADMIETLTAPTGISMSPADTDVARVRGDVERVARAVFCAIEGVEDCPENDAHIRYWLGAGEGEENYTPDTATECYAAARAAIAALAHPASDREARLCAALRPAMTP